jgi:hypothetical protein
MRNGNNETLIVPWFVQLLPFMERNDIYDAIQDPQKAGLSSPVQAATYLELAICPSDLPDTENQPHLSYVANMGVWDEQVKSTMQNGMGFRDRKANGVSHNLAGLLGRYSGIAAPARNTIKQQATNLKVSPSYVSSNDGTSTTMLMTENVDAGFWFATEQLPEDQGQYGVVWTSLTDQQYAINENAGLGSDTNVKIEFARPSSNHSGIVVVVFCDGHTLRLNEQVDREVYGRLMTPNGRESYLPSSSQNPPAFQVVPLSDTDLSN